MLSRPRAYLGDHGRKERLRHRKEFDTQVWVLTHPDLRNVARIKALTDHLHEQLSHSGFIVP